MKKTILPVCAALLLTGGLVSCGSNGGATTQNSKPVSLSVWVSTEQMEWAKGRIEDFKAQYPNKRYNITVSACAEGDVQKAIKTDPTAAADVFFFAGDHLGPLVEGNYLYEFPEAYAEALGEDINQNVLQSAMVDGKLYGIPYTPNSYFLFYNADKVTAEDCKDLDTLLEKGKVMFEYTNGWYQTAFWYGTGVRFFGENGTDPTQATLNTPEGVKAAKAIRNYALSSDNFYNAGAGEVSQFTADSDIVAMVNGAWCAADLTTQLGNSLRATTLPTFTVDGQKYPLTATGDWKKCGVAKYTYSPADALNLALFLTNADSMIEKLELFSEAPVLNSLANHEAVVSNEVANALMAQTNSNCVLQPTITQMSNWWDAATGYANELIAAKALEYDAALDTDGDGVLGVTERFTDAQCEEWAATLQENLLAAI